MLSLTKFAGIARQYGVPFEVCFTDRHSYVWVGGKPDVWVGSDFMAATMLAGGDWQPYSSGMRMILESLT